MCENGEELGDPEQAGRKLEDWAKELGKRNIGPPAAVEVRASSLE
jgi:hypothetical protein